MALEIKYNILILNGAMENKYSFANKRCVININQPLNLLEDYVPKILPYRIIIMIHLSVYVETFCKYHRQTKSNTLKKHKLVGLLLSFFQKSNLCHHFFDIFIYYYPVYICKNQCNKWHLRFWLRCLHCYTFTEQRLVGPWRWWMCWRLGEHFTAVLKSTPEARRPTNRSVARWPSKAGTDK